MFDIDKWREIINTLSKNKLRTFLTAFGVFWGIFMLLIMLGSGNGLQNAVFEDFGNFSSNCAFIWTRNTTVPYKGFNRGRRWNFTNRDMVALRQAIPEIKALAPRIQGWGTENNNVVRGDKTGAFTINGDSPQYRIVDPCIMKSGRFLNKKDVDEYRKVAVIGPQVREVMFEDEEEPVGKYLKIKGIYFQVVGVFEPENNVNIGGDKEQTIYIPYTTMQKAYNFGNVVHYFSVVAIDDIPVSKVEEKCMDFLAERHSISPEDEQAFGHFNLEEQYSNMANLFMGIKVLIWIVGIGTLLAGVIGVSNIMLITIKERTKEIGIKRAIGATPIKVIWQVISESVFLTSLAGSIGMIFGVLIIELVNAQMAGSESEMFRNPEVSFKVAFSAIIIMVLCGTIAGLVPARRAVKLKPIDALRHE